MQKEQPFSIEETYFGAKNRLKDLKSKSKRVDVMLYISIESGNAKLLENHNFFDLSVCVIDDGNKQTMTTLTDIGLPKKKQI